MKMPDGTEFRFWDDTTEYTRIYHVARGNPLASDQNAGTQEAPFATITRAAEALHPGEKVIVHGGIYRECVKPSRGGAGPEKMIAYEAAPGEKVIIRGSESWRSEFKPSEGWHAHPRAKSIRVWMGDLPPEWFAGYNPFMSNNMPAAFTSYGRAWSAAETRSFQLRRGAVFADGNPLRQVFSFYDLTRMEADIGAFWVEDPGLRIHFRLPADADPATTEMEVVVREQVFAPWERRLGYIRLSGFHLEHSADGVPIPQRALVSASRGHHWIIEDNRIAYANACGIDIGRQSWFATLQEPSGGHIVRRNHISRCGICGICGPDGVDGTLVEDNIIEHIGGLNIEHIYECAGLKFHTCKDILIRRNVFRHLTAACGLWLDIDADNCRITGNVFADIQTLLAGVYLEIAYHTNLVDRNIFWDMRDAPDNTPPKDGIPGGMGLSTDCCDKVAIYHNFFGSISGHYAIGLHLAQKSRVIRNRVGLGRGMRVFHNLIADCRKRILLSRLEDNLSDGNLFDAGNDSASLCVEFPEPRALVNLEAWQEYFAQDRNGSQTKMKAEFDPERLELRLKVEGRLPECRDYAGMDAAGADQAGSMAPGPWMHRDWQKTETGQKLTLKICPEAGPRQD